MTVWTPEQLSRLNTAQEVRITPLRPDGTAWPGRLIWVVVCGDHVLVRSWKGAAIEWYVRALESGRARLTIEEGGSDFSADVSLRPQPDAALNADLDAGFLGKYGDPYASEMVAPLAAATTLELSPV